MLLEISMDGRAGPCAGNADGSRLIPCAAVLLLVTHGVLLAWAVPKHSPCIDEVGHLAAGVSHWVSGDFGLYRVNPPLVRLWATLPVVLSRPATDWRSLVTYPLNRAEYTVGADFVQANRSRALWYFTLARSVCIPLSLVGGYVCYRWAGELHGPPAGLIALILWCFCPNILAHGQMLTPDVGATALGVAAAYLFWRWLRRPGWHLAACAGLVLGLAELAKFTMLVLYPLWPTLWIADRLLPRRHGSRRGWLAETGMVASILGVSIGVIHVGYGFEDSFRRLGNFTFESRLLGGVTVAGQTYGGGNRFADSCLAALPVPLPGNYLQGIDVQQVDFEFGFRSYLCGQWKVGGWWYYYLVALLIKVPLGTWTLVLVALGLTLRRRHVVSSWNDELVLLAPPLVLLCVVSSKTGFNHHMRYVLPILPFVFIWAGKVGRAVACKDRATALLTAVALSWSVAGSLWIYPHSLSYFNELVGGPMNGHRYLLDSNIDSGQDLLYLKQWIEDHPQSRPLRVRCTAGIDPALLGIATEHLPGGPEETVGSQLPAEEPRPGWDAISANVLRDRTKQHEYFVQSQPVATAGYSIYIYQAK
jgi:hypothetical protein